MLDDAVYRAYKATDGADPDSVEFESAFIASLIEQAPLDSVTEYLDGNTAATLASTLSHRVARSARMSGRARLSEVELQREPWVRLQRPEHDPELDAILFGDTSLSNAV
ncbi:hypothetical protein G6321_00050315 [Bradyrhizobium barranii subsp. barranii]|uniref:Uncharacterized protein n=1 Tax=Bradyrhizobium barranii subsp. barranii TaxID=2823807 RepID=A0A7Z0Q9B8_9BRAD|nr:hypothetical protein [Bradyrhizobium barranii]UGX93691.1 hypothetical protein G6321_00050315 [Bradyrhizobium barranii subsp. barranii]